MIRRTILCLALALGVLPASQALARGGGGCIEEGTPVLTPRGYVPIERLAPGEVVLAPAGGAMREATVQACLRVQPQTYVELEFDGGRLRVTPEHPLAAGEKPGVYRMASALAPGDGLRRWDGEKFGPALLLQRHFARRVSVPAAHPSFPSQEPRFLRGGYGDPPRKGSSGVVVLTPPSVFLPNGLASRTTARFLILMQALRWVRYHGQ